MYNHNRQKDKLWDTSYEWKDMEGSVRMRPGWRNLSDGNPQKVERDIFLRTVIGSAASVRIDHS